MDEDAVIALLERHLARYPAMQIADAYKLLFQAVFGPGHAVANKKAAREWLEHDFDAVPTAEQAALAESVHPGGAVVRVYLQPFAACGGQVKRLLDAMVRSGEQVVGDAAQMASWWDTFERACQPDGVFAGRFPLRELRLFGAARMREQWPAVHHSPAYVNEYHPSYRVLTAREAEALCAQLRVPYEPV